MKKFISYGRQWIDQDDINEVVKVLKSDYLTQGPAVEAFEKALCQYTGAKYALALSSATAGLHLAVACLELPKASEGITSPNTFVASSNSLLYNGLLPKFADIDPKTYNLDPAQLEKQITKKTKVIIPVHYAGQPCEMAEFKKLANKHNLFTIEDAAHAIGSKYADGSRVGNCKYSDITIFSFHPIKNITSAEGGAVLTNSKKLYDKLVLLRSHGITKDSKKMGKNPGPWYYEMQTLGFNYRLSDIHCALGLSQLKKIEKFKTRRKKIISAYNQAFKDLKNVVTPHENEKLDSMFHLYTLKVDFKAIKKSRSQVMAELKERSVGSQVLYIPVYIQPYYRALGFKKGLCPEAEQFYEQALSIPLFPKMTDQEIKRVIDALREVISK